MMIAGQDDRSAVIGREQMLYAAMLAIDYARLAELLSDDLSYVHSTGVVETKAEYFAGLRDGLYQYGAIERLEGVVRMLGDAALSLGVIDMHVGAKGSAKDTIRLRYALLWEKQAGAWRLVLRQATRIPLAAGQGASQGGPGPSR